MKTCPICKIRKRNNQFDKYFSKERGKYRLQNYCKTCQPAEKTKRSKEYYQRYSEERKEYVRKYRADPKNKTKLKKMSYKFKKKYRKELQACYVADLIGQKWGITSAEVRAIPGLIEAYRTNIKLKRKIWNHEKQTARPKKSPIRNNRSVTR